MNKSHKEQKEEAMRMAEHHAKHASVDGMREERQAQQDVKDMYYHQSRDEYMSGSPEERAKKAVPKEMLEREYDKSPGGGYTHKKAGSYRE